MSKEWTLIGNLRDIPVRGSRRINTLHKPIAVFRTAEDRIFALQDECPHKQGPLSAGIVHDGCVTCPLHNWVISLDTGEVVGIDEGSVRTFPVKLDGDRVLVSLDTESAEASSYG